MSALAVVRIDMDILLLTIGKTKTRFVCEGIDEYTGRLKRYVPFSLLELPDIRTTKTMTEQRQKEQEGEPAYPRRFRCPS